MHYSVSKVHSSFFVSKSWLTLLGTLVLLLYIYQELQDDKAYSGCSNLIVFSFVASSVSV